MVVAGYTAARYLLNISTPERDMRGLRNWLHYQVRPIVTGLLDAWNRVLSFIVRNPFYSANLELIKLRERVWTGYYADDTASAGS